MGKAKSREIYFEKKVIKFFHVKFYVRKRWEKKENFVSRPGKNLISDQKKVLSPSELKKK